MRRVITYGSLRKNHGNWKYILNQEPLKTEVINIPFKMISLGGFPGLIPAEENHDITVEVYEVDNSTYSRIEALEGFPNFYQKAIVPTSLGEYEIYVLEDEQYQTDDILEHGDWNKHYTPRHA